MEIDYSKFTGEISVIPSGVVTGALGIKEVNKRRLERLGGAPEPLLTLSESARLIGMDVSSLYRRKEAGKFIQPVITKRQKGSITYLYRRSEVVAYKRDFPPRKSK